MWSDLRLAARTLSRTPLFAIGVIGLLAFGMAACVVIFTLADALLLRPLPVKDPESLVRFITLRPPLPPRPDFRREEFEAWQRDGAMPFQELLAWSGVTATVTNGLQPESVRVDFVTGNYFASLGVSPAAGTLLTAAEGTAPAVLSYPYWRRRFAEDPSIVGKTIEFEGRKVAIVGVSARGFHGLTLESSPDIRLPLDWMTPLRPKPGYRNVEFEIAGRLKPGITREAARQQMESIWTSTRKTLEPAEPARNAKLDLQPASRGISRLRNQYGDILWMLLAGVALMMLIVCANVAGLFLARGSGRASEWSLRAALGATRAQLLRPLFAESLLLVVGSLSITTLLTIAALRLISRSLPPVRDYGTMRLPMDLDFAPDFRVTAFASVLTVAIVLFCGLLPALFGAARRDLQKDLKRPRVNGRQWLIGLQVALCTMLLCGAGAMLRTLQRLSSLDPGFEAGRVVTFTLDPAPLAVYSSAQNQELQKRLLDGARSVPGVESAALGTIGLMRGSGMKMTVARAGESAGQENFMNTSIHSVSPEYFETMGVKWIEGRNFTGREDPESESGKPVIVNEAFVRRLAGGKSALGGRFGSAALGSQAKPEFEVIGIVGDAKYRSLREPVQPTLYAPLARSERLILHVRTRNIPVAQPIHKLLAEIDPKLSFVEVSQLRDEVADSIWPERAAAFLGGVFSVASLMIVAAGLYALIAFAVTQRRREIAIRMAVGAVARNILELMLSRILSVSAAGIAVGVGCAWVLSPRLAAVLYEVNPRDPMSMLAAAAVAFGVALCACLWPALRAARTEPAMALRQE